MSTEAQCLTAQNDRHKTDVLIARIGISLPNVHMFTHSKFELLGVNWDFEAIIRIKRLEICCDEVKGEAGVGGREGGRELGEERRGNERKK